MREMIFDIGCHGGEDFAFYLEKGFRVVAVEANPILCEKLKKKFTQEISDGRLVLIEKAIAETHKDTVDFFINSSATMWGTISRDMADRNAAAGFPSETIEVPSITFGEVLREYGVPYYLKIDIEGADLLCLKALSLFADRPRFLSFEIHHRSTLFKETRLLIDLGYSKFQIVDQGRVHEQMSRFPAREGNYVEHPPARGGSGTFGEELPGLWLTRRGLIAHQLGLIIYNRMIGLSSRIPFITPRVGTWRDLHAAIG